jgi:hypothetical protein
MSSSDVTKAPATGADRGLEMVCLVATRQPLPSQPNRRRKHPISAWRTTGFELLAQRSFELGRKRTFAKVRR